ncbi:MAG: hypothetical protein F6K56_41580, partial [Moorea sp. SIO3G5]|nr:hypothetical protein [Moorena sp. SIO3G5]
ILPARARIQARCLFHQDARDAPDRECDRVAWPTVNRISSTTPHSLFPIPYSLFPTPYSLLPIFPLLNYDLSTTIRIREIS